MLQGVNRRPACEHRGMAAPDDQLWARPVFSVGDATYHWSDVADFARRGGEWERLRHGIRLGLACRRAGFEPTPAAVDQAARAFRYDRKLITADETEAWLAARSLDVRRWMDFIRREVLRAEHPDVDDRQTADVSDDEVDALVWVDGWCGGHFDSLSKALAQRVVARACVGGDDLDGVLDRFEAAVVTPDRVEEVVARRRLDWMLVALDMATFANEGAAREAALSLRSDGLTVAEVCDLAGVVRVQHDARLESLDPDLRTAVLGAREGAILGPVQTASGFVVAHVASKALATADDPEVRGRAAAAVTATALRQEVEERVRWHDR